MQVPIEFYRAVVSLHDNPSFQRIVGYLRSELTEQDVKNRFSSAETLYRGQGYAQCLSWLLDHIDSAEDVVHK